MSRQVYKLSYESLIALMQGKDLHVVTQDAHFVFKPPFDGLFITHDEIAQMRYKDQMQSLEQMEKINKHIQAA